jgi:hypothetical protein
LTKAGEQVVEVNRPNRLARRMDGKSDRLDAEQIARAVLGQTSTAIPKSKSGMVEVIRTLRVTRASSVKARTQAFNTLWGVMIGAPSPLRDELVILTKRSLVNRCLRLRPQTNDFVALSADPDRLLMAGVKTALRDLAICDHLFVGEKLPRRLLVASFAGLVTARISRWHSRAPVL